MALVEAQNFKLAADDARFKEIHEDIKQIRLILGTLLYTNIILCQKLGIDCDEVAKLMVKHGVE